MRRLGQLLLGVAAAAVAGTAIVAPASADTDTVGVTSTAWYTPLATCALPTGCGPFGPLPIPSRYPAGTLHVGVRAGVEEARTYLRLDLDSLPTGAYLTGTTLTLPLAPTDAGTFDPAAARLVACWLDHPFAPADGAVGAPPTVDCNTTASAVYVGGASARFTVDLDVFAARWASGDTNNGIVLVPAASQAPGATWHAAFYAPGHQGGSAPTAAVTFDRTDEAPDTPAPLDSEDALAALGGPGSYGVTAAPSLTPPTPSAAPIVEQAHGGERAAEPARRLVTQTFPRFRYPIVMSLPLVVLLLGGYLGRALTRPLDAEQ